MTEGQKVGLSKKLLRAFLQKYIYFFTQCSSPITENPGIKNCPLTFLIADIILYCEGETRLL